jgi:glycosyltransferase involved in cell wall biosynthesis
LGVDRSIFYPEESKRKPTIFLNVGKWEVRKGHDVIVDWFRQAFNEEDDVELWLMWENPFFMEQQMKGLSVVAKMGKLGNKIRIIPRVATEDGVADIMRKADCGVFPARAEGWNLELLEMMSCGKHVITTDYSAHTEFCSEPGARLVNVHDLEPAHGKKGLDDRWFFGQGNWAKLDNGVEQQFIHHMRVVHEKKKNNELSLNEGGIEIAKQFTWTNTVNELLKIWSP